MGVRFDSVAREAPSITARTQRVARVLGALVLLAGICLGFPAAAQFNLTGSDLAGVVFQTPSNLWIPDAARSQAAALNDASALVDRACGATEFHIWPALGADRDAIRMRTDTTFAEAGWSLAVINIAADGDRVYLASRGEDELVMAWLPLSENIGLVICLVTGPRVPDAGLAAIEDPALQLIPLPRPRPDPDAVIADEPFTVVEADPMDPNAAMVEEGLPPAEASPVAAADAVDETPRDVIGGIIAATNDEAETRPEEEPGEGGEGPGFSIWLLIVAVLLGVGAFFLMRWGRDSARAIAGASWPTTLATVIYTEIASESRAGKSGDGSVRYIPVVAYEYDVDGTSYQAARLRFGDSSQPSIDAAQSTVDKFPVGAGIEIRYDPKAPGEATVEADPDRLELRLIGGIAMAVLALAALIIALG